MKMMKWLVLFVIIMTVSISLIIACSSDDDEDEDEDDITDDDATDDDAADDDSVDDDDATDDDDDSTASCTLNDICTLVYDKCPEHDLWNSIAECEAGWFGYCYGTMDEAAYMDCVCDCFNPDDSCDDFFDYCEWDCWTDNCDEAV